MISVNDVVKELRNAGLTVSGKQGIAETPKLSYPVCKINIEGMSGVSELLTYALNNKAYLVELGKVRAKTAGKDKVERKQAEYTSDI